MFLDQQTRSLSLETTTQDIVTAIEEDAITTAGTTDPLLQKKILVKLNQKHILQRKQSLLLC